MERTPLLKSSSTDSLPAPHHLTRDSGAMDDARISRRSSGSDYDGNGGLLNKLGSAKTRQYLAGITLLLGVVTLWSLSDFISAALQTGHHAWNKPFLITYLNTASFAVYLIPSAIKYRRLGRLGSASRRGDGYEYEALPATIEAIDRPSSPIAPAVGRSPRSMTHALPHVYAQPHSQTGKRDRSLSHTRSTHSAMSTQVQGQGHRQSLEMGLSLDIPRAVDEECLGGTGARSPGTRSVGAGAKSPKEDLPKLTIRETAKVAAWWAAAWFLANWTVNASLALTSVASVSILSSTSGFFTLALGKVVGVEEMTRTKVFAVLASFMGVILVTKSDSSISPASTDNLPANPLAGDFLALLSAAMYAVYVIWMKVAIGDEERADMRLLLGFAGLFSIVFLGPIIPLLHIFGLERFELPPTRGAWLICGLNMLITLSSDYMYMLAMLKTTPILVTIGISLTIPLALVGSLIIPTATPAAITALSLGGAAMVTVAFALLGWQEWQASKEGEDDVPELGEAEIRRDIDSSTGLGLWDRRDSH